MESHPAISTKQERALHCLIGGDVYTYRNKRGRRTVVVKLNGLSGLSACTEQLLRVEATPRSGCCKSDVESVGGANGYHLLKRTLVDE